MYFVSSALYPDNPIDLQMRAYKSMSEVFNPEHFVKASINPIGEFKKERALPGQGGTKWSHEVWDRYIKATTDPTYQFDYTSWKEGTGRWKDNKMGRGPEAKPAMPVMNAAAPVSQDIGYRDYRRKAAASNQGATLLTSS